MFQKGYKNLICRCAFLFLGSIYFIQCTPQSQQTAVIKIGVHSFIKQGSKSIAVRPFPDGTTEVKITITLEDGSVLASENILLQDLSVTVPSGKTLWITGDVSAGQTLTHHGSQQIPALYPGQRKSVSLTLDELNGPIQIDITAELKPANLPSSFVKFSDDNRYMLFLSDADNLTANDSNNVTDLFVKDRTTNSIRNIHTASDNLTVGDGAVQQADFSGNGRYVVFSSQAGNLVPGDTDGKSDIFIKDLQTGEIRSLSASLPDPVTRINDYPSISNDGQKVVFHSYVENQAGVDDALYYWQTDFTNETITQVISGGGISLPKLSPDGSRFAYLHKSGEVSKIRIHQTSTLLSASTVATVSSTSSLTLNSNGQFIVFDTQTSHFISDNNDRSDVYVHNEAVDSKYLISSDAAWEPLTGIMLSQKSSISDDARYITFTLGQDVYVKNRITGHVMPFAFNVLSPNVSPNGELLTYGTDEGHIYFINNPLYRKIVNLTDGSNGRQASISPDGLKIVYTRKSDLNIDEIWTMNTDGSNPISVTAEGIRGKSPDWSPDGHQIVYKTDSSVNIMNMDGSNNYVFAQGSDYDQPAWSHDGLTIAMTGDGEVRELYYKSVCTNQTECSNTLAFSLGYYLYSPCWAPSVDYSSFDLQDPIAVDFGPDIWLIDWNTGKRLNVTNGGNANRNPAFSPDGSMIAYDSRTSGNRDIWVIQLKDQLQIQITTDPNDEFDPVWSPDGTKLFFTMLRQESSTNEIHVVDLNSEIHFPAVPTLNNQNGLPQIDFSSDMSVANAQSRVVRFSENNNLVLFLSDADNLTDDDTNGGSDLFIKNTVNGSIVNVHTSSSGIQGDGTVTQADMSADGKFVVFASDSSNLVPNDTDGVSDIFRKEIATGAVISISASLPDPLNATSPRVNDNPSYSDFKGYITYHSQYLDESGLPVNEIHVWMGSSTLSGPTGSVSHISASVKSNYFALITDNTLQVRTLYSPASVQKTIGAVDGTTFLSMDTNGLFVFFDSTLGHSPLDQNGLLDLYLYNINDDSFWLMSSDLNWNPLSVSGADFHASMSEDARLFAFELNNAIYVKSRITSQLMSLPYSGGFPVLNQDGSNFSFSAMNGHVYLDDNPLFTKVRNITAPSYGHPDIRSDGRIVFQTDFPYNIWTMDSNGKNRSQLTNNPEHEQFPVWSPNGSLIAYQKENTVAGQYEVWFMNQDGTGQQLVYNDFPSYGSSSWSPDGSRLSFAANSATGGFSQIMTRSLINLLELPTVVPNSESATASAWGPMAVGVWTDPMAVLIDANIWLIDLNGIIPREQMTFGTEPVFDLDWRPDGTMIAFTRSNEIWVLDVISKQAIQISNTGIYNTGRSPVWSTDGKKIIFDGYRNNLGGFWEHDLSTGIQFPSLP